MTTYQTITTDYGVARIEAALATGIPLNLTHMAVGDGNGAPVVISSTMTALVHEVYRTTVNVVQLDPASPAQVLVEIDIGASVGGWTIREFGIFDDQNQLFAVGNYPDAYKTLPSDGVVSDLVIATEVTVSNASVITLVLDPNIAVASRAWVESTITPAFLFPGGTTHQVLRKVTNLDGDTEWADVTDVNVIVQVVQEIQTVTAANQLTFNLLTCTTDGLTVHVGGALIPKKAGPGGWQPGTPTATQVVLGTQYPLTTEVVFLQNEPANTLTVPLDQSKNLLDVLDKPLARSNMDIYSREETDQKTPAGSVMHFAMSTAPTGWLKANGAQVSRTTYAALFAAIGTAFGAGNGTTTFTLPDGRGQFLRGFDDGRGVDAGRAFGSTQASQNLSHNHTGSSALAGDHSHTGSSDTQGSHAHSGSTSAIADHTHTGSTSAIGDHTHPFTAVESGTIQSGNSNGRYTDGAVSSTTGAAGGHSHSFTSNPAGGHSHTTTTNTAGAHAHSITTVTAGSHAHNLTIDLAGGSESRPPNLSLLICIKY